MYMYVAQIVVHLATVVMAGDVLTTMATTVGEEGAMDGQS